MRIVAVDIETYDPDLKDYGDGSCSDETDLHGSQARLLVVGTYDGYQKKAYYPFTSQWSEFVDIMADEDTDKVFHNGIYDLSWLCCGYDIEARGNMHDTMTRMTYVDEYAKLDLDSCCKYFGVQGKNKADTIEAWWEEHKVDAMYYSEQYKYAKKIRKGDSLWDHSAFLWDHWPEFREQMVKYNLQDCVATFNLYFAQESKLSKVYDAYMVDVRLTPLIIRMKKNGVRINTDALSKLTETVQEDWTKAAYTLSETYGITPDMVNSSKQLGKRLNEMGIHSPVLTATGAESWGVDAMKRIHHPVVAAIQEFKNYDAVLHKFLHGSLAKSVLHDGRIHCTFSPNKRETGGTVTGRFACSKPNLQQIPARDKEWGHSYGQAMRSLFIPEEGCMMGAPDYSQIEYLLLAHYAQGPQAAWFREQANAGVDFHTVAMQATGITTRSVVKTFNYGVIYGMGWRTALDKNYSLFEKLAADKGTDVETFTRNTYDDYHARLPVIRETMKYVQNIAKLQGYVMTIGGRYQHKPKAEFDPVTAKMNDFIYKMLNKLIQGSAADILKFSLLKCWDDGLFDVLTMHLTVHDENVVSIPYNKTGTEAMVEFVNNMNMSFNDKLKVPMKASVEVGPDWGYWDSDIWNDMKQGKYDRASECWWSK